MNLTPQQRRVYYTMAESVEAMWMLYELHLTDCLPHERAWRTRAWEMLDLCQQGEQLLSRIRESLHLDGSHHARSF